MTTPVLPHDVGRILTDPADMAPFLVDWRGRYVGRAQAVIQPGSTAEVARLVSWCAAHHQPIVPQGGNTGLTGAGTPDDSGAAIVLSLTRMHDIRAVDPVNNTLTAEAGAILQHVQEAARDHDRLFPLSLAAEGRCTIGGNLATNAGGTAVLRYGTARELCLGLEVVTAQGTIWHGLHGLRKDNTGYALRDLFIGSEGTLGVITAATLKLFPRPAGQYTALAALGSPEAALHLLSLAQSALGPALTAFEYMAQRCLRLVAQHFPDQAAPFRTLPACAVLLEACDPQSDHHARAQLEQLLSHALEQGVINDAVVAQSTAQAQQLWHLRECISEAQSRAGRNIKHDIALPISALAHFITTTEQALAQHFPGTRTVVFGHFGDGNLHFNVCPPPGTDTQTFADLETAVNTLVHAAVLRHGGSLSAEHGIGVLRRHALGQSADPTKLALMRQIKQALDPLGIMNPGKLLPSSA